MIRLPKINGTTPENGSVICLFDLAEKSIKSVLSLLDFPVQMNFDPGKSYYLDQRLGAGSSHICLDIRQSHLVDPQQAGRGHLGIQTDPAVVG